MNHDYRRAKEYCPRFSKTEVSQFLSENILENANFEKY